MPTVHEVFGSRSDSNPLAYVVRPVQKQFVDALANPRFEAVVTHGTSKQGKSSLRRSVLPNEKCTFASASLDVNREGLYREVLHQAGVTGRRKRDLERKREVSGGISLNPLKWLGIGWPLDVKLDT